MTPINAKTQKAYQGGNIIALLSAPFENQTWATYRQWLELGKQVQKGSRGTKAIKMVKITDKKTGFEKMVPRGFTVFNIEQVKEMA